MALLVHGGSPARRAAVTEAIAKAIAQRGGGHYRIGRSSRAAEAAKWLADASVRGVVLLDAPVDADAVRAATARVDGRWVLTVDPHWTVAAIIEALLATVGGGESGPPASVSDRL